MMSMKRKSTVEDAWKKGVKRKCRERWGGKTSWIGGGEGCECEVVCRGGGREGSGYEKVCRERWGGWRPWRFNTGCFTTQKETLYLLYRRLGGSQSGLVQKISPTPTLNPQTIQPISSCCTHYAVLAHKTLKKDIMGTQDTQDPTAHKWHIKLK